MTNDTKTIAVLTTDQAKRKAELEQTIKTGLATFMEVGNAIAEINRDHLYADEFDTFDEYLAVRWNIRKSRAYQLMSAASTAQNVSTIVEIKSEGAIRPLTKLPPKQQVRAAKVLAKSVKAGKPITVATVAQAVAKVAPRGGLAATLHPRETRPRTGGPVDIIDQWWAENGATLCEYPVASPRRVYELIRRLFE